MVRVVVRVVVVVRVGVRIGVTVWVAPGHFQAVSRNNRLSNHQFPFLVAHL